MVELTTWTVGFILTSFTDGSKVDYAVGPRIFLCGWINGGTNYLDCWIHIGIFRLVVYLQDRRNSNLII